MQTAYNVVSAAMLLWTACIWSGKGILNILIKSLFAIASFGGAIMVARALSL